MNKKKQRETIKEERNREKDTGLSHPNGREPPPMYFNLVFLKLFIHVNCMSVLKYLNLACRYFLSYKLFTLT
jgi:hypothetical protein